jgi:LmbE family N-acetylglucosaminyl deacetylase
MAVPTGSSDRGPAGNVPGPLAVVAHPDDGSFGLGAVLAEPVTAGARVLRLIHPPTG